MGRGVLRPSNFVKEDVAGGLESSNVDSLSLLVIVGMEPGIGRTGGCGRLQGSTVVAGGSMVPYMLNHRLQLVGPPENTGGGPLWEEDIGFSLYAMMQLGGNAPSIAEPTQLKSHDIGSCDQGMLVVLIMPALDMFLHCDEWD